MELVFIFHHFIEQLHRFNKTTAIIIKEVKREDKPGKYSTIECTGNVLFGVNIHTDLQAIQINCRHNMNLLPEQVSPLSMYDK